MAKSVLEEQRFESVEEVTAGRRQYGQRHRKLFPEMLPKILRISAKVCYCQRGAALKEVFCKVTHFCVINKFQELFKAAIITNLKALFNAENNKYN
jgi:hypothetical protein